jgi:hypothetical protein
MDDIEDLGQEDPGALRGGHKHVTVHHRKTRKGDGKSESKTFEETPEASVPGVGKVWVKVRRRRRCCKAVDER